MSVKVLDAVKPGLVLGDDVQKVFAIARENEFAIPAVNVVGTNTVNSVMEAAKVVNSPVIIQFSNGGAAFWSGKALSNDNERSAIAGGIMGALHVHHMAALYGVPVILHTDHAARKLLPWIDGLLDAGENHFEAVAIASSGGVAPCGACRQVLHEFAPRINVLLIDTINTDQVTEISLEDLLPDPFPSKNGA